MVLPDGTRRVSPYESPSDLEETIFSSVEGFSDRTGFVYSRRVKSLEEVVVEDPYVARVTSDGCVKDIDIFSGEYGSSKGVGYDTRSRVFWFGDRVYNVKDRHHVVGGSKGFFRGEQYVTNGFGAVSDVFCETVMLDKPMLVVPAMTRKNYGGGAALLGGLVGGIVGSVVSPGSALASGFAGSLGLGYMVDTLSEFQRVWRRPVDAPLLRGVKR